MNAHEAGRLAGVLLIVIVIPAVLAFWAVRLRRRGSGAWWIPAAFAVIFFLSGIASRAAQETRQSREAASIIQVEPERAFPADTPYRFEPVRDREFSAEVERLIQREAPFAEVAARLVVEGETPIGFALAITAPRDAFVEEDFMEGVARGIAERSGRPPQRGTIAGRPVIHFEISQGGNTVYGVVWRRPRTNLSMFVAAGSVADLRELGRAMIRAES